jgi:O-acetyl-ADP-ribose deacetylase (regulator of RNase III)
MYTGRYEHQIVPAAHTALRTLRRWMDANEAVADDIDRIIFCLYTDRDSDVYKAIALEYFPPQEIKTEDEPGMGLSL